MKITLCHTKREMQLCIEKVGLVDTINPGHRKPNTNYSATQAGKDAFKKHIGAIEKLLK